MTNIYITCVYVSVYIHIPIHVLYITCVYVSVYIYIPRPSFSRPGGLVSKHVIVDFYTRPAP
jgi:hypothetical protein